MGDNSLTAITTAGISITVEFRTHISDPAATKTNKSDRKQTRGASAYDEYSTFPANASVADSTVFTRSALNKYGIIVHRGHLAAAGQGSMTTHQNINDVAKKHKCSKS